MTPTTRDKIYNALMDGHNSGSTSDMWLAINEALALLDADETPSEDAVKFAHRLVANSTVSCGDDGPVFASMIFKRDARRDAELVERIIKYLDRVSPLDAAWTMSAIREAARSSK